MYLINRFLKESTPENPNDIVFKNKFYPLGLTENDIWQHWLKYKSQILEWVDGRYVAFFIRVESNKLIMKRKINGIPIRLNENNYEKILTGRTNVLYVEQPQLSKTIVLDIDPGKNHTRQHAISIIKNIKLLFRRNYDQVIDSYEILTSGEKGIHILAKLKSPRNLTILKTEVLNVFSTPEGRKFLRDDIVVDDKVSKEKNPYMNIDLSSMNNRGLHICKNSLTKEGLLCTDYKSGLTKIL